MDEKYWSEPNRFRPERFLNDDGLLVNIKPNSFIPFSYGRRVCPGEDLAINDMFLILVRFIQLTNDYDIVLCNDRPTDDDLEPNRETLVLQSPKSFDIMFKT
ncbi:cytochrome P450 2B2-like, partial [Oppia nitens]|uniref:cytochrome P450 2B2-like n=1 Tax=Oppia nitens TaxID=1686743 RepID=UPI0023DC53D9